MQTIDSKNKKLVFQKNWENFDTLKLKSGNLKSWFPHYSVYLSLIGMYSMQFCYSCCLIWSTILFVNLIIQELINLTCNYYPNLTHNCKIFFQYFAFNEPLEISCGSYGKSSVDPIVKFWLFLQKLSMSLVHISICPFHYFSLRKFHKFIEGLVLTISLWT